MGKEAQVSPEKSVSAILFFQRRFSENCLKNMPRQTEKMQLENKWIFTLFCGPDSCFSAFFQQTLFQSGGPFILIRKRLLNGAFFTEYLCALSCSGNGGIDQ